MKIKCTNCSKSYMVDDGKVAGKRFGFDCPNCGKSVVIDNRKIETEPKPQPIEDFAMPDFIDSAEDTSAKSASVESSLSSDFAFDDISSVNDQAAGLSDFDDFEPEIDLSVLKPGIPESDLLADVPSAQFDEEILSADSDFANTEDVLSITESDDDSTTIDLNSLDIDLSESEEVLAGDKPDEFSFDDDLESEKISLSEESLAAAVGDIVSENDEEDESLTLDLDSLDIPLEESDDISAGESAFEDTDEKLSIGDAGLTLDDIESSDGDSGASDIEPMDLDINLDEISPELPQEESILSEFDSFEDTVKSLNEDYTIDKLPDIEFDDQDETNEEEESLHVSSAPREDQFLDIDDSSKNQAHSGEMFYGEHIAASGGGYANFTVDYSFHYSRVIALLKILGVYYVTYIPHYIVYGLYSLIAGCAGLLNQFIILFTGESEHDFYLIQENTMRYGFSLFASVINAVEEKPLFAGKKNVDYQLQLDIMYAPKNSRFLSFMRITGIGIFILAIPHLLLLGVLSVGMWLLVVVSLFTVLITGRWSSFMFDFIVRYLRYATTVSAYMTGLIDTYPSFRFE